MMPIISDPFFMKKTGGLWVRNRILLFDSFYSYGEHETSRGMLCFLSLAIFCLAAFLNFFSRLDMT